MREFQNSVMEESPVFVRAVTLSSVLKSSSWGVDDSQVLTAAIANAKTAQKDATVWSAEVQNIDGRKAVVTVQDIELHTPDQVSLSQSIHPTIH